MRFLAAFVLTLLIPFVFIYIPKTSKAKPTSSPSPSLTSTPSPTIKPTQTPSPTTTATPSPTPTTTPKPTVSPTITPTIKDYSMNAINDYRVSQGLDKVSTDPYTCNFAKIRAQEISLNFYHDGFRNRLNSNTLPYPSHKKVVENISMNSDYKQVVKNWIASSPHAENLRADTKFGCIEFEGNYYVYLGWQP